MYVSFTVDFTTLTRTSPSSVDEGIPYKTIFQLLLQFLVCCCGAVGIQVWPVISFPQNGMLAKRKLFGSFLLVLPLTMPL